MKQNKLKENYLFNAIYQVLLILLPIITTPYVSRVLDAEGIGAYNYTNAIISVFVLCANLGSGAYAQREIAFCGDNIENRSVVFFEILFLRIMTFLAVTPVYFVVVALMHQYMYLLLIQYAVLIGTALDVSWLFQGLEEFKLIALRNIVIKAAAVILTFIFVRDAKDLFKYAAIASISCLISVLVLLLYLRGKVRWVNHRQLRPLRHLKQVVLLFLPIAAIYVYTTVDKIILGVLSSDVQVGYYSQAEKVVKLSMTVITSLGAVLLPRVASLIKDNKMAEVREIIGKSIHFVLFLGLPMTLGMVGIAPIFIPWFLGSQYEVSIQLMQYLAVLVLIIGLSSVTGQAVMIPLNRQGTYALAIVIGATLNVTCNFIFIPRYEALGAVIGTLIAESTVCIVQLVTVTHALQLRLKRIFLSVWKNVVAAVVMYFVVVVLRNNVGENAQGVFLVVLVGSVIYLIVLLGLRDAFTWTQLDSYAVKVKEKLFRGES